MAAVQLPNTKNRFAQLIVSLAYPCGFAVTQDFWHDPRRRATTNGIGESGAEPSG